jgi:hypothetical protein
MEYEKNLHYLRSASADQITEAAVSGKPRSGLGSRGIDREPLDVEEPDLQNKYMGLLKGMRPEKTEVEDLADLGPTDEEMAETSDEVTSMIRPKGKIPGGEITLGEASSEVKGGYPLSQKELEAVIIKEANLRNIDPTVAVAIFRSEGAGAYQSQIARSGKGSLGGKEASFGPYQLYTGGGLGNQYEKETGRTLTEDNSIDGLKRQVQFSLDAAVDSGWTPWYGRKTAGVSERQGLSGAKKVGNWRD